MGFEYVERSFEFSIIEILLIKISLGIVTYLVSDFESLLAIVKIIKNFVQENKVVIIETAKRGESSTES